MDNNNDAFNSLGLESVSLNDNPNTQTKPTAEPAKPAAASQDSQTSQDDNILNDLSDEETIDLFIEGIMQEKGVDAPTEEIHQELKNSLKTQLLQEIDRSLIGELPDTKLDELNRIVAANGQIAPEIIAKAIQDAGLDVTDIVGNTMVRFREIYLGQNKTEQAEE